MTDSPYPVVHLIAPGCWHETQVIACNAEGKAALLKLLKTGEPQECFVNDGEGFDLVLFVAGEDTLPLPYTDAGMGAREKPGPRLDAFWERVGELLAPLIARRQAEWEKANPGKRRRNKA